MSTASIAIDDLELVVDPNIDLIEYIQLLKEKHAITRKVMLVQTPQFLLESFNPEIAKNRGYYAYPPTGLQCVIKALAGKGIDISIFDLNYLFLKKVIENTTFSYADLLSLFDEELDKQQPSIVGFTCLTAYGDILHETHPLTAVLGHLRKRGKEIVILGGPTVTNEAENYLKRGLCHFVVTKEGENKIQFLMGMVYHGQSSEPACSESASSEPASGIYFLHRGQLKQTEGTSARMVLAGNLIPTYAQVPIEAYKDVGSLNPYSRMAGRDVPFGVFQLNRGCRANCRFCDVTKFMGRGVRSYDAKSVIEELTYLICERGIRHFEVLDDDFLGNREQVIELLQGMIPLRTRFNITWAANNGLLALTLDEELLNLIRDSGCIGFRIGVESGNREMLARIRKPASLPFLRKKAELLQHYPEMFVGANYILGLFGEETFSQMLDTLTFANEINLDWSSITTFQFTSKETATVENLKSKGGSATDFIPAKDNKYGEIQEKDGILSGKAVFTLPPNEIPTPDQVKQIWFTFNLITNYINNKNLKPEGRPEKFIAWVEAIQASYPQNPYMCLFAALAHVLLGREELAMQQLRKAKTILGLSSYWQHRFNQFQLAKLVEQFPMSKEQVYTELASLQKEYVMWL